VVSRLQPRVWGLGFMVCSLEFRVHVVDFRI
jgi:hypothetical protein